MMGQYESLPFMSKESVDLDHYVTNKSLDGLFYMIGQEEKKIRTDPAARVTDLLKNVLGSREERIPDLAGHEHFLLIFLLIFGRTIIPVWKFCRLQCFIESRPYELFVKCGADLNSHIYHSIRSHPENISFLLNSSYL
jgi:hypothetical protein